MLPEKNSTARTDYEFFLSKRAVTFFQARK
jgi:hypothetical protein